MTQSEKRTLEYLEYLLEYYEREVSPLLNWPYEVNWQLLDIEEVRFLVAVIDRRIESIRIDFTVLRDEVDRFKLFLSMKEGG